MEKEDLNIKLYEKLYDEQQVFRDWLLSQPPEVIIQHSFEELCCKGEFTTP